MTTEVEQWVLLKDAKDKTSLIPRHKFQELRVNGPSPDTVYPNSRMYDLLNNKIILTEGNGHILDVKDIGPTNRQWAKGEMFAHLTPKVEINRPGNENFLTIDDVQAIHEHPRLFYEEGVVERPIMERLMETFILQRAQFDELFVVEEKPPESPLLKAYLAAKASLVLKEIESKDEIDDIEMIEIQAYKQAGYSGKDIQTVKDEAMDYIEYSRFLMIKGDKTVISEEDYAYFENLYNNMKNDSLIDAYPKVKNMGIELISNLSYSSKWMFKSIIPFIYKKEGSSLYEFYTRTNLSLSEYVDKGFDRDLIRLRIALASEIATQLGTSHTISLFVSDKYGNFKVFNMKNSTLKKLREKDLKSELKDIDKDIDNSKKNCPFNIPNEI